MRRKGLLLLSTGVMLLVGIGQPAFSIARQQSAAIADEDQVSATVESVDQIHRTILLRGPEGSLMTVVAGPTMRNLKQLKPGDRVVVRCGEALAASLAKPDTAAPPTQAAERSDRAPIGQKPGGSEEQMIRTRVTITRIDPRHNLVSFVGPARTERTVAVLDPEMQRFLRTLKAGDQVDLTYTEALAVSVEPMGD